MVSSGRVYATVKAQTTGCSGSGNLHHVTDDISSKRHPLPDRKRDRRQEAGVNSSSKPFNAALLKTKMETVFPGSAD